MPVPFFGPLRVRALVLVRWPRHSEALIPMGLVLLLVMREVLACNPMCEGSLPS